ncbi:S1 family peptidase [Patulibacter minatonensis]|uniref:S1 family peptidase n=1 Tax=Patulibacter minatonensis TaxID=298163 RepID=UPI00047A6543|nr:trypsin-like serine protease [Patulibacter minatonensis]
MSRVLVGLRPRGPIVVRAVAGAAVLVWTLIGMPIVAAPAAIVSGVRVEPSSRPAVVRLAEACTATLVAPRRLLTAAHCVSHVVPGTTAVRIGGARYVAVRVARHPRFQYLTPDFPAEPYRDLGLVELDRDVTGVRPIAVARGHVRAGQEVELSGYGTGRADRPGDYGVLRRARLVVRSAAVCRRELGRAAPGQGAQYRGRVMLCTQDADGRRPFASGCYGDSGAPLTRTTPRGRTVVVGVDSWGVACGTRDGDPEVFARVSAERRFLEATDPGWTTVPIEEPFVPGRF